MGRGGGIKSPCTGPPPVALCCVSHGCMTGDLASRWLASATGFVSCVCRSVPTVGARPESLSLSLSARLLLSAAIEPRPQVTPREVNVRRRAPVLSSLDVQEEGGSRRHRGPEAWGACSPGRVPPEGRGKGESTATVQSSGPARPFPQSPSPAPQWPLHHRHLSPPWLEKSSSRKPAGAVLGKKCARKTCKAPPGPSPTDGLSPRWLRPNSFSRTAPGGRRRATTVTLFLLLAVG